MVPFHDFTRSRSTSCLDRIFRLTSIFFTYISSFSYRDWIYHLTSFFSHDLIEQHIVLVQAWAILTFVLSQDFIEQLNVLVQELNLPSYLDHFTSLSRSSSFSCFYWIYVLRTVLPRSFSQFYRAALRSRGGTESRPEILSRNS